MKMGVVTIVHLKKFLILSITVLVWPMMSLAQSQTSPTDQTARIGVLAFRGVDVALERWRPLIAYLNDAIAGWQFEAVPVTLISAPDKINANELEFLITNPGHYVTLAEQHGLSALATRERRDKGSGTGLLHYGTVIFTRKESGIHTLDDLKGKRLAAVSPEAFGGFQMAWSELRRQNIDPFTDLEALRFMGFPQDAIVTAVLSSDVDAGVIRSGLLENLAAEGKINLADIGVLQGNAQLEYPYMVSGRLYPEWPFTALPGINKDLREDVSRALLATQNTPVAARFKLTDLWSAPLSYEDVRKVTTAYRQRGGSTGATPADSSSGMQGIYAIAAGLLTAGLLFAALQFFTRRSAALQASASEQPVAGTPQPVSEPDPELISRFDSLTKREREILSLICTGQPSKSIATSLGISPKTVEYHRANLLQKTDAGTTAHLVQLATRLGYDQGFSLGQTSQ